MILLIFDKTISCMQPWKVSKFHISWPLENWEKLIWVHTRISIYSQYCDCVPTTTLAFGRKELMLLGQGFEIEMTKSKVAMVEVYGPQQTHQIPLAWIIQCIPCCFSWVDGIWVKYKRSLGKLCTEAFSFKGYLHVITPKIPCVFLPNSSVLNIVGKINFSKN